MFGLKPLLVSMVVLCIRFGGQITILVIYFKTVSKISRGLVHMPFSFYNFTSNLPLSLFEELLNIAK
jgi:hypothetical protein